MQKQAVKKKKKKRLTEESGPESEDLHLALDNKKY